MINSDIKDSGKKIKEPVSERKVIKKNKWSSFKRNIKRDWMLYLFLVPTIVYLLIFNYIPMFGIQIAFKDFYANLGILGSPWVGLKHFTRFFNSHYFKRLFINTIALSFYGLLTFPLPILFALMLHEIKESKFKSVVQTIGYAPYFISVVVVVGMIISFLDPETGIVNHMLAFLGSGPVNFLTNPKWFRHIFTWSGVWQTLGWNTIIYLAALSGVSPELHESAKMDGATRFQRVRHINIPSILPTIVTLFILALGGFMSTGFEKALLLQNSLNAETSDIIQTFVYEAGILGGQYSFAAAVGLFESVINVMLIVLANYTTRKVSENSLW